MAVYIEGNLRITFPRNANVRKFDDPTTHGLSCMKAVDFIVEESNRLWFMEFKDPEHPNATEKNKKEFTNRFKSGKLDDDLKYKYRDSFLYEWASERADKPIHYCVLIGIANLTGAELLTRMEELKRKLPLHGPLSGTWQRPIVARCAVFNIAAWNRSLPRFPVERI